MSDLNLNDELLESLEPDVEQAEQQPKRNSKDDLIGKIIACCADNEIDLEYSNSKLRRMTREQLCRVLADKIERGVKCQMAAQVGAKPGAPDSVIALGALKMMHNIAAGTAEKGLNMVLPQYGYQLEGFTESLKDPAVDQAVDTFGGIDILVNNASAISLTGTEATTMKSYDLMHQINSRGTFMASKLCLPHLKKAANPHILNLAPPLNMAPHWFGRHVAYTMAKYGMSLCVLGMADEYAGKVAVNALWPKTVINTAAVQNQLGGAPTVKAARQPSIMADAAWAILTRPVADASGHFFIDEDVLRSAGVNDFSGYRVDPDLDDDKLLPDFFLD